MVSTRDAIRELTGHLTESVGNGTAGARPQLSPVANPRDVGRRSLREFGTLQIDVLVPDPDQPRRRFDEVSLQQLADSIADRGQLSPIRVRWSADKSQWLIVSGERRWRAAKLAGLSSVNCHFVDGVGDSTSVLEEQLIENIQRQDLDPLEEARAFRSLIDANGWTGKQLAERLRVHPSRVSRLLSLLTLPDAIIVDVEAGRISSRTAYEISREKDPERQQRLAGQAASGKLTHTDANRVVDARRRRKTSRTGCRLFFQTDHGISVTTSAADKVTYHQIEAALLQALEEVRHRIDNNVSFV